MNKHKKHTLEHDYGRCCSGSARNQFPLSNAISRRQFVKITGTSTVGAVAIPGLTWASFSEIKTHEIFDLKRAPLIVKPIFTFEIPVRQNQTSWRPWGGIQSEEDAEKELEHIREEHKILINRADFPLEFLPVASVKTLSDLENITDVKSADLLLVYAAGGGSSVFNSLLKMGKNLIFFCRHKSGPVYLWYEIISPRFLRQHTDKLSVKGVDQSDIVIDSQDELLWRFRAMCGLKNTLSSKIIAIGGPGAWAQPPGVVPGLVQDKYKLDIQSVTYEELGKLLIQARTDKNVISGAKDRAREYLNDATLNLETNQQFVENCFVLEYVFKRIMEKFNARALTVNSCMGTIMPLAETSACLTLSLLNDAGYLAFCESDFVVIPTGILLANISNKPVFLNDPTYPHDGIITLAHCTAPRLMDGKKLHPARLLSHFESDYGAAPKVEMLIGQSVTCIMPDFDFKRNAGLAGIIADNPFLDICRSQVDINYKCDDMSVADQMPGFHWMMVYGDYKKEYGYAIKKIGIDFLDLG